MIALPSPAPRARHGARALLAAWFVVMAVVSGFLLARHLLPLPRPAVNDAALADAVAGLRRPGDAGHIMAVHVLYAECQCSRRIIDHLLTSRRPAGVAERVILVGRRRSGSAAPDDRGFAAQLTEKGFTVVVITAADLEKRFRVASVPLLIVTSPDGAIRYAGGYSTRKQGPELRDLEIIDRASDGTAVDALPVFGCAVADALRRKLDPLGVL